MEIIASVVTIQIEKNVNPFMKIRRFLKPLIHRVYQPLLMRYLARQRSYRYGDIRIRVHPGVFHPGLFFSTKILLQYLAGQALSGKSFLELGAGSGLISVFAAHRGATVTASDISQAAIANIQENARLSNIAVKTILSDLFAEIAEQRFDWIIINPPYYPRNPTNESEHAWFCGEDFQYFQSLFSQLGNFINADNQVVMILSEDCQLAHIRTLAADRNITMSQILQKRVWGEENYIFRLAVTK